MPRVTLDTNDVRTYEATEPGPYTMTIDEIEPEVQGPNEKGTLFMTGFLKFTDPALDKKCGRVRNIICLNGAGAGFTRDLIKAATGEEVPVNASIDFDTDALVGRTVLANIGNKTYKGKLQNEIESIVAVA